MHKHKQKLSKMLTWLVIMAQILALVSTATAGTIQPTPQMAQETAQKAGLGDWIAQRVGDLTAWAQPLWGTPQRVQAAPMFALSDLAGNVATPWVQSPFQVSATTARTPNTVPIFGCSALTCPTISNPNNTTDSTTTNYAAISFPALAVLADASIRVTESDDDYAAGTFAGFKIAKVGGLLDLSLFDNITIRTYLNGTQKETKSGTSIIDGSLLGLIGGGSVSDYVVGFWTTQAFDAVEIYQAQPIGLNLGGETRIFHAVLEKAEAGPALTCNAGVGTNWLKPLYPVRLNDAVTGVTGICAGCSVDGASNVIDSNTTNYANINVGIGLAGGGQIAVYDPLITSYPAGTFAGFVVEDTGGLGASLLDAFVLETYLDGVQQQSIAAGSLIDFPFFSGKKTIGFTTSQAFDEVRIRAVALASLNVNLRVYQALLAPAGCTMTGPRGPGGVTTGLEAWVKADAGTSSTTDGATVATWSDQSGNGYDFTQATTGSQPTYYSTTADKLLNFNPVLDFDGTGDYLRNTNVLMPSASPYTFLAVGVDEDTGTGYRKLFGSEAIVDYFGLYKQGGATGDNGWIPYAVGGQARSTPFIGDRGSMGKGTKYSADGGANGYWNGTNFTSDSRTDYAQPQIVGFNSLNNATSDPFYTWTDGYKEDPNWSPIVDGLVFRNQFFTQTSIGADVTVELWKGRIPEFMAYSQSLSDSDIAKINTYLAIKYGITLGQGNGHVGKNGNNYNYVATDGTTIWDGTANSTYAYNIAGIGRDDAEALTQKQSKSIQTGFQPVIGLGAIAATNAANNHTFAVNKSYLVWGDNGQTASYGTAYSPTTFTPAAGYFRMSRIWKVQETGAITNVVVQADADHLIVSSDPTFASGVTEIAFNSGSATVDFANGQFFTFGKAITAPGAVVNELVFWSKADDAGCAPGDACADWGDRSLNGNPIETIGAMTLQAADAAHNFHPYFSSFSTANYFKDMDSSFATPWPPIDVTEVSVFAVARSSSLTDDGRITGMDNDDNLAGEPGLSIVDGSPAFYRFSSGPGRVTLSDDVVVNTSAIFSARTAGTQLTVGLNGKHTASAITAGGGFAGDIFNIGYGTWDISGPFPGDIQEVIWYRTDVSDTERQRIESYLALKYGITLDQSTAQNYLAGDGTTVVWDATTHAAYSNNIAGIGRDDASALNQKQATSTNSGFQPVIGLGTIAASNGANSNTFGTNKTFMLWGSNNQTASYGVSYTPTSFTPAAGYYRMARVWKVQETGTITNVVVQGAGTDHLLVSSDPTFATGVTEIDMSSGSATVNFTDGQYFTFGKEQIAPGGVATDLAFWYKPEAGISLNSDKVSAWVDQATGIQLTPAVATNGPTYYDVGTNLMNFNPVLNFTSATRQDGLRVASGLPAIPNGVSTFSVLLPDDASVRWFLHWGVFGSGYYNNYGACNANNPGVWTNSHGGCVNNPTTLGPITTPSFLSVRWNTTAGTNQWQLRRNGQLHSGTTTATALNVPADTALEIGDVNNRTAGNEYVGNISEVIGYTSRLSDTDRQKVESYLAIKYGITYMNDANTAAQDYLNAVGATVWDAAANSAYSANIAGIGRDDASALQQKQSQSVNSGFQPAIGLGTIANSNAANPNTFSANKSFLLWGSNNAATTLTANYVGGSNNRVARVWKVQETGTVGAVKVVIPRSAFPTVALRSLIVHASDPNFGTTDRTYVLVSTGGNYEATVDFNNGDFFTFSSSFTIPEINVTPGTLDFGEVNTGSTAPAQAVTIQNEGEVSLSLSNISLSGADAARFAISSNNCGATLSAGASCTVQITFSPTTAGSRSALLVITNNDSDESTVNVALSGTTPGSGGGGTLGTYNLAVTKSASVSTATVGVPFTYTITVYNKGTIAASNVTMTDQLPAGVTFGSANATGGGTCNHSSGTVTCTWASLAGSATATVTISVTP